VLPPTEDVVVVDPVDAGSAQEMAAPNKSRHWPSLHVLVGSGVHLVPHATVVTSQPVSPLVVLTELVVVVVVVLVVEGLVASGTNSPLITVPCTPPFGQIIPPDSVAVIPLPSLQQLPPVSVSGIGISAHVTAVPQFIVQAELVDVVVVLVVEGLVASGTNSPLTTVPCTPSGQVTPSENDTEGPPIACSRCIGSTITSQG
jgi:hypothetical protein